MLQIFSRSTPDLPKISHNVFKFHKICPQDISKITSSKEAFLQRKQNPAPVSSKVNVDIAEEMPQQGGEGTFKCDICGNIFKSDNGLKIHKGKSHKTSELPQLEKTRDHGIDVSLNAEAEKPRRRVGIADQ